MGPKTVLITGTSEGGIGDALARAFHKKGLRVFATARNLTKVQHLKEMGIEVFQLDVVDSVSIKEAVETVKVKTGGTLDILVNNAGSGYGAPMLDTDVETARKVFDLNVFSVVAMTRAFAPYLIASKGTVVNISSIASKSPVPWQGYYNATKAAVDSISNNLRIEMAPLGVKVVNVLTGGIKTKFFQNVQDGNLPASSIYAPAKDEIEYVMSGKFLKGLTEVDDYADLVVKNALKTNPKAHLWAGSSTGGVWFLDTFGWPTAFDFVLGKVVKMSTVSKKLETK